MEKVVLSDYEYGMIYQEYKDVKGLIYTQRFVVAEAQIVNGSAPEARRVVISRATDRYGSVKFGFISV